MNNTSKTTSPKYLWKECLSFTPDDETVVFCTSSTQFQIVNSEKRHATKGGTYWKRVARLLIDTEKLQLISVKMYAKYVMYRNVTYAIETFDKGTLEVLEVLLGKEETERFKIKYGIPSFNDRFKSAWRGDTIKDVLKKAGLPSSKNIIKAFLVLMEITKERTKEHYMPNGTLPDLTFLNFIWTVIKNRNKFEECLLKFRPSISIDKAAKLNKVMFKKFYSNLDKNQKIKFCDSLIGNAIMLLPDAITMINQTNVDINTIEIKNKTIEGIHDTVDIIRKEQTSKERSFYKTLKLTRLPYLHNVDLSRDLRLEYPEDRSVLEYYGDHHHNCVGSYFDKVIKGKSIILGVYKKDKHVYTAEVDVQCKRVIQLRGFGNSDPLAEDKHVIDTYVADACLKNNLKMSDVRMDIKKLMIQ
jgi:hypothetical protein